MCANNVHTGLFFTPLFIISEEKSQIFINKSRYILEHYGVIKKMEIPCYRLIQKNLQINIVGKNVCRIYSKQYLCKINIIVIYVA